MSEIEFYGLSTCMWCKKTKKFLEEKGCEFEIIWVNEIEGEERDKVDAAVDELNPERTFPTVKIGDCVVVGYKPEELEEAVKKWQASKK